MKRNRATPCSWSLKNLVNFVLRVAAAVIALGILTPFEFAQSPKIASKTITFRLELGHLLPRNKMVEEGDYVIVVLNRAFVDEIPVAIEDDRGRNILSSKVLAKRAKGKLEVTLKPGRYVVSSPISDKYRAELTVTERKK